MTRSLEIRPAWENHHDAPLCARCKEDRWAIFCVGGEWFCVDCYPVAVERLMTEGRVAIKRAS